MSNPRRRFGDLESDPAEPENTSAATPDSSLQRIEPTVFPAAIPDPGLGANHAPRLDKHHRNAEIGHVVGQDVGRIGDAYAPCPACTGSTAS